METHGRTTIYANVREQDLLKATLEERIRIIAKILTENEEIHNLNSTESKYLTDYLYGKQDISEKIKKTRKDINNKGVENWAWAFEETKKSMLVGKPIVYAPFDNVSNDEITQLNKYIVEVSKDDIDQQTYEELYTVGRSFVYCWTNTTEDNKAPFDLLNLDILNTEVVYSSSIKKEQLFAYVVTPQMYQTKKKNEETGKDELVDVIYHEYTVYCRDCFLTFNDKLGDLKYVKDSFKPNIYNKHIIVEYYLNKYRVSPLEIGKDVFNDINYVESLDKDDIESFVNAIMVFTNAKIDEEKMAAIEEYGAISIKSTNDKKASVEMLQNRLKSNDTQTYYIRKLMAIHEIMGVPTSQNNENSNAETGQASLVNQGYTSANLRAENEEKAFKHGDKKILNLMLTVCREKADSKIKELNASDVDIKFSRDLSDGIIAKTQALLNMTEAKIPPQVRNAVINLFSDPVAVTKLQEEYEKELEAKEEEKQQRFKNNKEQEVQENKTFAQNNKMVA